MHDLHYEDMHTPLVIRASELQCQDNS
jgi:hypothetical protein